MPHICVIGASLSGKSFLMGNICRETGKKFGPNLVMSSTGTPDDFPESVIFSKNSGADFLKAIRTRSNAQRLVVIDEPSDTIGKGKDAMDFEYIATTGRHHGHRLMIACHKQTQIAPIMREMCETFFVFKLLKPEAKKMVEMLGHEALIDAPLLEQGNYFKVRGTEISLGRLSV